MADENTQRPVAPFADQLQEPCNESAITDCNTRDGMDDAAIG